MNNDKYMLHAASQFTLWDHPLVNHFQDMEYSINVLDDKLYPLYENANKHPASLLITTLLKATSKFLHATSIENGFMQSSVESKTETDIKSLFKTITEAINYTQHECQQQLANTRGQLVLRAAIVYCKTFIALRLNDLKQIPNNKFYDYYHNHCHELQKILSTAEPPSTNCAPVLK